MPFTLAARAGIVALVLGLAWIVPAEAQETPSPVTLEAPARVSVGATVEIRWKGEVDKLDFISIDPVGAPDNKYSHYIYPHRGTPGNLRAPERPGQYAIRYHSGGKGYTVRGSSPLSVIEATATFEGPLAADSGAEVVISWNGPANDKDFISIDPADSDDRKYGKYAYAKSSPVKIRAPEQPGQYLIRYHLGRTYRVIGQTGLTVGSVSASLEAPAQVQAGGKISVEWSGPNGQGDYVSIDPPDAPDKAYLQYAYTRSGSPALIQVPEEPGSYEIRYHQGQKRTVIATIDLEVLANVATVAGPPSVSGGSEFEVTWTGPDNSGDYVTIVPAGAESREYLSYHYTKNGTPGTLDAPLEPGNYELRYMTGRTRGILSRSPIEVTPGAIPGTLRVTADSREGSGQAAGAVEVILDASGSMLKRLGGERRIEIAKEALGNLVDNVIPAGTPFALRVFGHRETDSCRTDLEIPVAPMNAAFAKAAIQGVQAMNLAKTPIAASLGKVSQDLAGVSGPVTVVLLTDGEETCDGDPRAAIEALRNHGIDVRVNIVGFAINELELKEQFESWARIGNGRYIEAHDKQELRDAMNRSLDTPFEVTAGDEVVGTGVVNGDPIVLPAGTYQVRVLGSAPRDLGEVTIEPRAEIDLRAN